MDGFEVSPPLPLLRYPLKAGDGWEIDSSQGDGRMTGAKTVGLEKITVPAGTFDAVVVTTEDLAGEEKLVSKMWFARNVGLLKQEDERAGRRVGLFELERYEPGK
jgi:hypothetical protein